MGLKTQDTRLKKETAELLGEPFESSVSSLESRVLSLDAGFSLVELVIALSILAVGLVGAMRVFPVGLRASQRTEMRSRAALVAQRTLESLKVASWASLDEGETRQEQPPFAIVTRIAQPRPEHLTDLAALKALEVTVEWTQEGRVRSLTFVTYVRRSAS